MRAVPRTLAGIAAAAALAVPMAGQADAATKIVKLQNDATGSRVLMKNPDNPLLMGVSSTDRGRWLKTDIGNTGYATYRNLFTGNCLGFRKFQNVGIELVSDRTCVPGDPNQEWRLGVARDLQLRSNGRVLETLSDRTVRLSPTLFSNQPTQKWTLIAG